MIRRTARLVFAAATLLAAAPGLAQTPVLPEGFVLDPVWPEKGSTTTGEAIAWDGDTIEIAGQAIRLHGIDAPEMGGDPRGPVARGALDDILAPDRTVTCEAVDRDRYKRPVARCRAGGRDLAEAMVLAGRAFSFRKYSTDYDAAEAEARAAGRGFWRGQNLSNGRWWDALESWQTTISAFFGFAGLIWVTRQGFKHTIEARQHSATLDHNRDDRQRRKETQALAAALMGEIASLIRIVDFRDYLKYFTSLKEHVENDGEWIKGSGVAVTQDYLALFSANTARLGLLPGDLPERVSMLYIVFKALLDDFTQFRAGVLDDTTKEHRIHVLGQTIDLLSIATDYGAMISGELAEVAGRPAPTFPVPAKDKPGSDQSQATGEEPPAPS